MKVGDLVRVHQDYCTIENENSIGVVMGKPVSWGEQCEIKIYWTDDMTTYNEPYDRLEVVSESR